MLLFNKFYSIELLQVRLETDRLMLVYLYHPIHIMFGSRVGFRGRRIEWPYIRLDQIQDRGRQPSYIILNGHISETVHPIQFVFGSTVKVWEKIMCEE